MGKPSSGSLTVRAILALTLFVGFYVLAFAVAAGMAAVIIFLVATNRINAYLITVCSVGVVAILWAIFPRLDRFAPPGPLLESTRHPRLFTELEYVAKAMHQDMPTEVYLIKEPNAWVAQRGGFMGIGSRRVMGLGLPLLTVLTVSQAKAIFAHEFGHYRGGDTRLGPWIYNTRSAIARTLWGLRGNSFLLQLPFQTYGKMFLMLTQSVSRQQEYSADKIAASVAGSHNMIAALRAIRGAAPAWQEYWTSEVAPAVAAGFRPPITEGFNRFVRAEPIARKISQVLERASEESTTSLYDSHPALKKRLAFLESLPPNSEGQDDRAAMALVDDLAQLEIELFTPAVVKKGAQPLTPATWEEILSKLRVAEWRQPVSQQAALLAEVTPTALVSISNDLRAFEQRLKGCHYTLPKQVDDYCFWVIGAAFALALVQNGWTMQVAPGELVSLSNNDKMVRPFDVLPSLITKELPAQAWLDFCTQCGISDLSLSQSPAKTFTE